jgi:hypothetical protein
MRKIITMALVLMTIVLTAAMEEYDRKSISIFKMDRTPGSITAAQTDVDQIYNAVFKKFTNMGRFDYNPIPAGVTNASELFEIVKEYTATKIEERAAKQWDIKNEYYGTNFVTGENVDKIMNGAYILFPRLTVFTVAKKKKGDDFTANVCVSVDIYEGKNTGTVENPEWTPELVKTINASGSNAFGNLFDLNLNPKKANKRKKAIKSATNGMLLFLEKELKKVDAFKIKALVTKAEPKKDKIAFNFGKNVGVKVDDAYTMGYFQKNKKGKQVFVETGFMKVRKVKDKESVSQLLIVTNPKNEKEDDLFNEYDQCYEYPLVGLNIFVQGGVNSFKYWSDTDYTAGDSELQEETMSPYFGLNMEYDVAKYIKVPELYLNASIDLQALELGNYTYVDDWGFSQTDEFTTSTIIAEFGFTKKIFSRRLGYYFGADFGYMLMTFEVEGDEEESYYSVGGKVKTGINYMISKQVLFDLGVGFRFYGELLNEDGDEIFEANSTMEGEGWLTPSGFVVRAGLGFTL